MTLLILYIHCNLLECIPDKQRLINEVGRVLKPGGQVVFCHYDWDSQIFNGYDKPLIRKIAAEFSDWKQDWMDASDGWMGRRMYGLFRNNPSFSGDIVPLVLVNTEYTPDLYGYQRIRDAQTMADQGIVSQEDATMFINNIEKTVSEGTYFYSITLYVYEGQKSGHLMQKLHIFGLVAISSCTVDSSNKYPTRLYLQESSRHSVPEFSISFIEQNRMYIRVTE